MKVHIYALLSRVLFAVAQLNLITTNDLKARRNVFDFIIETLANDVSTSNIDLSVGLYGVVENLPYVRTSTLYETQNDTE
jgi:hypothetical protein